MSNRCSFEAYVRPEHAEAFADIVFGGAGFEEGPEDAQLTNAVYFSDPEADYGHHGACIEAAKQGLEFITITDEGYDYGPARGCAVDGKFHSVETDFHGYLIVRVEEDGESDTPRIVEQDLDAIRPYLRAYRRVRAVLSGERGEP